MIVLKGGFLLSSMLGITQRSTLDLDFSISDINFTKELVNDTFEEILSINLEDEIQYELLSIKQIMEQNLYPGFKISIIGSFENIRVPFSVDIATGDPITPHQINYNYKSIIIGNDFKLYTYNLETVLAEKLQTIINRKTGNSRMKDFYDIFIMSKLHMNLLDTRILKNAIENTFSYRNTLFDKNEFKKLFNDLYNDVEFLKRWKIYVKNNYYVDEVYFKDVKIEILNLIELVK